MPAWPKSYRLSRETAEAAERIWHNVRERFGEREGPYQRQGVISAMIYWLAKQPVNTQYFVVNNGVRPHPLLPAFQVPYSLPDGRGNPKYRFYATDDEAALGKLLSFASCLPKFELLTLIDHVIEVLTGLDQVAEVTEGPGGEEKERSAVDQAAGSESEPTAPGQPATPPFGPNTARDPGAAL